MQAMKRYLLLLLLACCTAAHPQAFEYANPFRDRHVVTVQIEPPLVAAGDRGTSASFCTPKDKFRCVNSEWFNFAVPISTSAIASDNEWTYGGYSYQVIGQRTILVLGKRVSVAEIRSTQSSQEFRFLYSRRNGVVAFSAEVDRTLVVFFLQSTVGFGAQ